MKTWKIGTLSLVLMVAACGQGGSAGEEITTRVGALGGTARFNFVKTADWGSGYNARVDITNIGSTVIQGWSTDFDMPKNVQVNVANLPQCGGAVQDNCWTIFSDIGPENIVRIFHVGSPNTIAVGQTRSEFLYGSYEAAFGFPTRCGAPLTGQSTPCNGSTDVTPPTAASNLRIFGTGSTLVDLFWSPATDDVGVTGYILRYATRAAPALEIGEVPATTPITRARITRLVSDTDYIFFVEARDAAGNVSPLIFSPQTHTAVPLISVTFNTTNTWQGGGFQGQFRITNNESVPLDNWRTTFAFTGSFQSVWDGVLSGGPGTFTISAPAYNITLDPGETAIVGATGLFGNPATPPSGFTVAAGSPQVRALAFPQAPCLGLSCPNGLHCSVGDNGIPTCVP
jgi:cellulose binding protein with CBM2 domain/fibronectin type III domain protein